MTDRYAKDDDLRADVAIRDKRPVEYVNDRRRPYYYGIITKPSSRIQMGQSRGNSGEKIGDGYIVIAFDFHGLGTKCGSLAEDAGYKLHECYRKEFQVKHLTNARRISNQDEFIAFLDKLDTDGGYTDESYKAFRRDRD